MKKKGSSNLEQFLSESIGQKVWIGVDVHKRSYSVALCREDGNIVSWKTSADNQALLRQVSGKGLDLQTVV
ncbi:MAG: hypothetical protein IJZ18_00465, partial [Mailhella sp.]|nr:hypothetical protein [Mailhella sp.]